jgi:uncharacterized protein (DUF1697 family)
MHSVRTYINSGNVIFTTDLTGCTRVADMLEGAIARGLGLTVRVLVRDVDEIRVVVDSLPADWTNDETAKCDVFFLWDEVDHPAILEQLKLDSQVDDLRYTPGAVLRRVERKNATRSRLTKVMGTPLFQQVTARNCNTARKLLELMEATRT